MSETQFITGATHKPGEVQRFPCKQCGAGLQFAPGQAVLHCPYCGHREEIPTTPQAIREYCLETALLQAPRAEGWGVDRHAVHCENCGATTSFAEAQVAGLCAFCGSARVVAQESSARLIRPESLLPFTITREQATARFRHWISRLWFRPNDLQHAAQLGKIHGAYLPFWTFDAFVSSCWTAEAGYHYYETETYSERDASGNTVTRTRQVQRTRWVPAAGSRQDFFDDELVYASRGLPDSLMRRIAPFHLEQLVPYHPSYLAGFAAEEYQVDLPTGWSIAREGIQRQVYARCAGDVPGDTHRNLQVDSAFSQMTFKHMLLPVWVAAYLYGERSYRFLVNGQTGSASGEAPYSWWKISAAILAALVLLLLVLALLHTRT
jgi:predicted RNA-binding Zn-ribbon protein involved in translation (DUF1610 family)